MTLEQAELLTGLTARVIETPPNPEYIAHAGLIAMGDPHRVQLGKNVPAIAKFITREEDGSLKGHAIPVTSFQILAFGSSPAEAVSRYKASLGPMTDAQAKAALAALAKSG